MKTDNTEQKLRDYYREMKNQPAQAGIAEDIDDNLIARYIEGTAMPEEIAQLEKQAESNEEIKILLQTLSRQDLSEEYRSQKSNIHQTSNIFSFSRYQSMTLFCCAACLLIMVTGSFFIIKKINSSSETAGPQITLRGVTPPTNIYRAAITNKDDEISFQEKTNNN